MKRYLRIALACFGCLWTALMVACGGETAITFPGQYPPGPIVVVTVDTLRADHLGAYGYFRETSPAIDEFAKRAHLFERAVTTMSTTLPAHVSLWSSLYPIQTGVVANGKKFNLPQDGSVRFFAQMSRDQGYLTAAFVSATPVKRRTGIAVGFEVFEEPQGKTRRADETTDKAINWLNSLDPSQRFLLWLHYFDPHSPYEPLPEFNRFETNPQLLTFLENRSFPDVNDVEIQEMNNRYDGEILFVDSQFSRLLEALKQRRMFEESAIVLVGDHGEGLGQHDWIEHGKLHNEQLFVPLILKLPKSLNIAPQVVSGLSSIVDVLPTLVEVLGLPISDQDRSQFTGVNLLARTSPREATYAQRTFRHNSPKWGKGQQFALITDRWKYLLSTERLDELYDLKSDPYEMHNVLDDHPRVARKLQRTLRDYLAFSAEQGRVLEVLEEYSPETLSELRALGYLN